MVINVKNPDKMIDHSSFLCKYPISHQNEMQGSFLKNISTNGL